MALYACITFCLGIHLLMEFGLLPLLGCCKEACSVNGHCGVSLFFPSKVHALESWLVPPVVVEALGAVMSLEGTFAVLWEAW